MKTISQYREDIKELTGKIAAVRTKCTAENRDPLPEEVSHMNDLMGDCEEIEKIVASLERQERLQARLDKPEPPLTQPGPRQAAEPKDRPQDRFVSLGEQLVSVINADLKRGTDPRLFRAATGLNESVDSEGGFLVQKDFSSVLLEDTFETGVLARRCRRIPISSNANGIKLPGVDETSRASTRYGGVVAYWKNEAAQKTSSKPSFRQIELTLHKLIGLIYLTDELMQDAPALEAWVRQNFPNEFGFQIDDAIINGNGAGKPLGVLNAGCLVSVAKEAGQTADTIMAENVEKMWARMFARSLPSAEWFINQNCYPQLFQMSHSVGTGGIPVFLPPSGLADAPYGRLFGRPVVPIEQCATLGDLGDILFADFGGGYVLAEKGGIQSDISIHVKFDYDETCLRFVLRLDGQPVRASALTPYKGSDTQSHFIALQARA